MDIHSMSSGRLVLMLLLYTLERLVLGQRGFVLCDVAMIRTVYFLL